MAHGFSKENQSSVEAAYRFGDFALHPRDRILKKAGTSLSLQPKVFDALLCLVRRAEHLVSKQELIEMLWPDVHVSEANLTNLIVSLRKLVGRDAIRTISKHGYRLELPVAGEPGLSQGTYEKFIRAKELTDQRSLQSMCAARDLYWICLAKDPNFAPAWAWLGRCCWFLSKFTDNSLENSELALAAFERAFTIDPDLACAHQFYTFVQVDTAEADKAMSRLFERLRNHPGEPETFASLVQVLRFRGLLQESVEAHRRAIELDPTVITSVAHTFFLAGNYEAALETYGGRTGYYLDAAAWAALRDPKRAIALLRDRLKKMPLSRLMTALLGSLLALLEGRTADAARLMAEADAIHEPEVLVYFARHYAQMKRISAAFTALREAARSGFICSPNTLRSDAWLRPLQRHREFRSLVRCAENLVDKAQSSFKNYRANSKNWDLNVLEPG